MAEVFEHDTFLSPFTWRYGSENMRQLWSQRQTRLLWRRLWVALARIQAEAGLVTAAQVQDLEAHAEEIDLERALKLEEDLRHDLMAEVHTYAEQARIGGGIIHLGATSMDIEDNAEALRLRDGLTLIAERLRSVLQILAERIEAEADTVCMAFTHLQPAEPTTIGYRLAFTAQDLLADYESVQRLIAGIRGKGFKGAVGTSASYHALLSGTGMTARELEAKIMAQIGLPSYEVTHQTYPRRQDWDVLNGLAGIAMTAYKFAFDVRLLQSPPIGEWREPFGSRQIGSSAMPFKRNPINAENIDSLARFVASLPHIAWDNAAHHLLERTLDDSGNRRLILPEGFLAVDEILLRLEKLVRGFQTDSHAIARNLQTYGVFAATERVMMAAARRGGDRQVLHELIREHSMAAWQAVQQGQPNPLADLLAGDAHITTALSADEVISLLDATEYVGDAPLRARAMAQQIREVLAT